MSNYCPNCEANAKRVAELEAEVERLRLAIVDYANGDTDVHPIVALSKLVDVVDGEETP